MRLRHGHRLSTSAAACPCFGEKQYFLPDMPMSKLAMAEPIGIFIFNGIFDRFPDLRIGSMESGRGLVCCMPNTPLAPGKSSASGCSRRTRNCRATTWTTTSGAR